MLDVIPVEEAIRISAGIARPIVNTRPLPLSELTGRVLAAAPVSPCDVPAFTRSTMDGYAVFAADTFGAGAAAPVYLHIAGTVEMGKPAGFEILRGECARIPTGGMLPKGADAVIPVEFTEEDAFGECLLYRGVSPLENVVRRGDDVGAGETVLFPGRRLTPADIGVLAASGVTRCDVYEKPVVSILSTGNELVPVRAEPAPGQIRDVNSHLLHAMCASWGCETRLFGILPDEPAALQAAVLKAAETADIVLLSGGSSAGEADLTEKTIASLGETLAHGISMKPGKPTVIGRVNDRPVFGLPGHPAACYFVMDTVVKPCVERTSGAPLPLGTLTARIGENVSSNHGREEFLCVRLENGFAVPVYGKSGVVSQLSAADGYIRIPRDSEGLQKNESVNVFLFQV